MAVSSLVFWPPFVRVLLALSPAKQLKLLSKLWRAWTYSRESSKLCTVFVGRHSQTVGGILGRYGINTQNDCGFAGLFSNVEEAIRT